MTVGIPRSLFYYYDGEMWISFFKSLNIPYILSEESNEKIIELGRKYATDEMCLSLKNYIGHVASLVGKCDMILVPRIDNFGRNDQTCTNFLAVYDIIRNLFPVHLLTYNINYLKGETEEKAYLKLGEQLGFGEEETLSAYHNAVTSTMFRREKYILKNIEALSSTKIKLLVIGHPYNLYDEQIGKPILNFLKKQDLELIYGDLFHHDITNELSKKLSPSLYFKYSKDLIGAISLCEAKVDGVLFLTAFPCGLDSLVNELVMRKIKKPYLNLIVDDVDSTVGIETRIESFLDILEGVKK